MSIFKCKMCGGTLGSAENSSVCTCEYCGTSQTLPKSNDEVTANLFNRANSLRMNNDFDKALEVYESIVQTNPEDSEAYWGMVLCKYGIEYVDDPATKAKIPTCHRTLFKSIFEDSDYIEAINHADIYQKEIFEKEATQINTIQKGILLISNNEEPFDIFICYKETDSNGRRTQDSVLAQELYYQLIQEGFKVFFSRITLEDKIGSEYEPYIFAALNSSKVMVVVGTKKEHFNAVWVKNEWSRFIGIMQNDKQKIIIPAYRDMNPYNLPEALSVYQAQDMSKLGFMQDLIRGIRKILNNGSNEATNQGVVKQTGVNIENLLKRGYLALEDRKFDSAFDFFNRVLDENAEEYRAYIGLLCAENNAVCEEALIHSEGNLKSDANFKKACRFGGHDVQERLIKIVQQQSYNRAANQMKNSRTEKDFKRAADMFYELNDFSDSEQKRNECLIEAENTRKESKYQKAYSILNSDLTVYSLEIAKNMFISISDYKNSKELADTCDKKIEELKIKAENTRKEVVYQEAYEILNSSDSEFSLENAKNMFISISDYKSSKELADTCDRKINEIKFKIEKEIQDTKKEKKREILSIIIFFVVLIAAIVSFIVCF